MAKNYEFKMKRKTKNAVKEIRIAGRNRNRESFGFVCHLLYSLKFIDFLNDKKL